MTARGSAVLYTPDILALAVELAEYQLDQQLPSQGEARSRVCGSAVTIALAEDGAGRVVEIGARVSACAIGQASATLFLRAAKGLNAEDITKSLTEIEAWLSGAGPEPDWPSIAALASARAYPARHPAVLLPWKAALAALSNRAAAD